MQGRRRLSCGVRGVRKSEPVFRWKGDAPGIYWDLELQGDLEELANGAWALNPGDASADGARRLASFGVGHLKRDPHIFEHVVLRLVAAAVAINDQGGSAFIERAAERVHTSNGEGNRLNNARAATLAQLRGGAGYAGSGHRFTHIVGIFPAKFVHECTPSISCKIVNR